MDHSLHRIKNKINISYKLFFDGEYIQYNTTRYFRYKYN